MREQFQAGPKNPTAETSHAREMEWERELLEMYSEKRAAALIAEFVRIGTWQVPTLILLRNDAYPGKETDSPTDPLLRFVPRTITEKWKQVRVTQDKLFTAGDFKLREKLLSQSMHVLSEMQSSSVPILAGTDSAAPYVIPGFALHEELALLVTAGLSPMQALQAATRNPADFLGRLKNQGTIELGKTADLLLLDASPLDDVRNTQKIRAVILRGQLLDRQSPRRAACFSAEVCFRELDDWRRCLPGWIEERHRNDSCGNRVADDSTVISMLSVLPTVECSRFDACQGDHFFQRWGPGC